MKYLKFLIVVLSCIFVELALGISPAIASSEIITLQCSPGWPTYASSEVNRNIEPSKQRFFVQLPSGAASRQSVGVLVFISSENECTEVPSDWQNSLERNRLIFIAPQMAGNGNDSRKRAGLAVMAAMAMIKRYNVDLKRVYVGGFSGGARVACELGFNQPDLFRGTVQVCGAEFPQKITWNYAKPQEEKDKTYGLCDATEQEISCAKKSVRFALITGESDFRRPYIMDIYQNGFYRQGFQAKLFDIPELGHTLCSGNDFENALRYLTYGR